MEKINILYIDDDLESYLSEFLDNYKNEKCEISSADFEFKPEEKFEDLLNEVKVKNANIIIIDSKLYENRSHSNKKITGEEFKIILKKFFPFTETFVVTQNELEDGIEMIPKYENKNSSFKDLQPDEYYEEKLSRLLDRAIDNIILYRNLSTKMNKNDGLCDDLKEKVNNTMNGINDYNELTKEDIDELIESFKKIKEHYDGK